MTGKMSRRRADFKFDTVCGLGYDKVTTKCSAVTNLAPTERVFYCLKFINPLINPQFKTSYDGLREPNTIPEREISSAV